MRALALILAAFVGLEHIGIMVLEMFFWDHPVGRAAFDMDAQQSASTAVLAMNQGLYNGFLAAGIFWGLLSKKRDVVAFFLICVIVAGIFGALTAKPSIIYTQALPAALALGTWWLVGRKV